VVASRVGGLPEVIEDGVEGFLVPAGDPLHLARRLVELLADPELRRRMGAAARERTAAFTWRAVGDRTLTLYRDTVAGRR
jgi:glycosyltransferase involved in cell wall biosynthesis